MEELFDKYLKYINAGLILAVAGNAARTEQEDARFKDCTKVKVRPISVKGQLSFQVTRTVGQKEIHENMPAEKLAELLLHITGNPFKQVELTNSEGKLTVLVSKKGKKTILEHKNAKAEKAATAAAKAETGAADKEITVKSLAKGDAAAEANPAVQISHNRKKNYCLPEGEPVPFLVELGVMTAQGKVVAAKYDKFRQINRYLEFVEDIVPSLPSDRELSIIDFGCGKSYLTFALYYYLHEVKGFDVRITGLDLKEDVIRNCGELAKRFGYEKLQFLHGDIASFEGDYAGEGMVDKAEEEADRTALEGRVDKAIGAKNSSKKMHVDMVVTLHACDTATDYALEKAVKWGARVIFCVPCCQHELNKQISCEELAPILKYGLLKERISALLTDGLRANMLEEAGYRTQILEFIDMEHTPKNILIRAVRQPMKIKKKTNYRKTAEFINADPMLQRLLAEN
ncbi:MAG: SAM-dependent methyltransferase [Lachnospiraceae bacterium]|nr:SAM-dependent methyltransferase [Lachnospiraceae bacterium]